MTEAISLSERLERMSPKDRNLEFRNQFYVTTPLYELFPIGSDERSAQIDILSSKIDQFIPFMRVTTSCTYWVKRVIRLHNIAGTMREQFGLLFDPKNPAGKGLFGEEYGKEIDRLMYKYLLQRYFGQGILFESYEELENYRSAVRSTGLIDEEGLLRNWRNEFFDKYNEEP